MIICAAVKIIRQNIKNFTFDTIIVHGLRHSDCYATIALFEKDNEWKDVSKAEGFVLSTGEFLDRFEAYKHAVRVGQLSQTAYLYKSDSGETELYSGDLY